MRRGLLLPYRVPGPIDRGLNPWHEKRPRLVEAEPPKLVVLDFPARARLEPDFGSEDFSQVVACDLPCGIGRGLMKPFTPSHEGFADSRLFLELTPGRMPGIFSGLDHPLRKVPIAVGSQNEIQPVALFL